MTLDANRDDVDETLYVVAAGYEVSCSCGHEFAELYGPQHHLQLTGLPRNDHGEWRLTCPGCKTDHVFDGAAVESAW